MFIDCDACSEVLCAVCGHEPCPMCMDDCDHGDCLVPVSDGSKRLNKTHVCRFQPCPAHRAREDREDTP